MATFKYGRADVRAAAFDRPRMVEADRMGRGHELERDRDRREREERRRAPRSRSRSPPRRYESGRPLENRDRHRELERERALGDRRSPIRDRDLRERERFERPPDRLRDRDVPTGRRPMPPGGDRVDRARDDDRLHPRNRYSTFSAPPSGFSTRTSGFSSAPPPYVSNGISTPASTERCYVCGGIGHFGRDCPSNPQEVAKLRPPPRREVGFTDPAPPQSRSRALAPDDPEFPKCYECGKRGHVARECRFKQGAGGPIEQRCYNCGSVGHIARECPKPPDSRPPPARNLDAPPPSLPPRSIPDIAEGCYHCGRPGHFARECPSKFGPSSVGPSPMDRWLGGMPGPGPAPRATGFSSIGLGVGFGGLPPGGGPPPATEGCYECGQLGHFARECPMRSRRMAERAAVAAGAGGGSAGEGRRIASKASTGGRAEEAKLNYELEDYMKERASQRKGGGRRSEKNEEREEDRKLEEGEENLATMEEAEGTAAEGMVEDEALVEERDIEVDGGTEQEADVGGEGESKPEEPPAAALEEAKAAADLADGGVSPAAVLPNLNETAPDVDVDVEEEEEQAAPTIHIEAGPGGNEAAASELVGVDLNGEPEGQEEKQIELEEKQIDLEEGQDDGQEELDVDG